MKTQNQLAEQQMAASQGSQLGQLGQQTYGSQSKLSIFLTVSVTSFRKLVEAGLTVEVNNDHLVVRLETEKYSFTFSQDA